MVIKEKYGVVISDKQDKTITVSVQRRFAHKKFHKVVTISKNYTAADNEGKCKIGDRVIITETKPESKKKRWILKSVLSQSSKSDLV
jgi:small subunit ribosomal protein S17